MTPNRYKTKSTSPNTAEIVEPIILRDTKTTRLVFKAKLVDNDHDANAAVNGTLLFQRKGPKDSWDDFTEHHLSAFRKFEGTSLDLHAGEVRTLFDSLDDLYALYKKHGIRYGTNRFVRTSESLARVADLSDDELHQLLENRSSAGSLALRRLLSWYSALPDPTALVDLLTALGPIALDSVATLSGVAALRSSLRFFDENQHNSSEDFWHEAFVTRPYLLERMFPFPVHLIHDKAFLGGKRLDDTGGKLIDFLYRNALTRNVAFVEIKTPTTSLLGGEYREGAFSPHTQLSGAVTQVLTYRKTFQNHLHGLKAESSYDMDSFDSPCYVVAGHTRELDDAAKRRSFELFRRSLHGVEVVTYDELFGRVARLIDIIDGAHKWIPEHGT